MFEVRGMGTHVTPRLELYEQPLERQCAGFDALGVGQLLQRVLRLDVFSLVHIACSTVRPILRNSCHLHTAKQYRTRTCLRQVSRYYRHCCEE